MATQSGFSNLKLRGKVRHLTVAPLGSNKTGLSSAQMSLYELVAVPLSVVAVSLIREDKFIRVELSGAHSAYNGDVLRVITGNLTAWEFDIVKAVNATTVIIPNTGQIDEIDTVLLAGDTVKTMRWVSVKSDKEGNLNFSPGPTTFIQDTNTVIVTEDNAAPANNKGLPSLAMIYKDGVQTPISDDTDPDEVVAMPVKRVDTISQSGFTSLDFSINNVSDTAYEEIHASTPFKVRKVQIFMSSGTPLLLAFGAIGSEQDKLIIISGGNGVIDFAIPETTRLSVKSMSGFVDSGLLLINFLG